MVGTAKSLSVVRMPPRSSATTLRPASASSLPRMPPVQPRPTTTASTSLSRVAIGYSLPSAHIRNADGIGGKFFVAETRDVLAIDRNRSGKSKKAPARFVAVASVNGIGKHSFHHGLIQIGRAHV